MPTVGNKFTWICSEDGASSRLDRFLVFEGLIGRWKIVVPEIGNRDIFDHSPMWIKTSNLDCGLNPFKANNCWFDYVKCMPFVKEEWDAFNIVGNKIKF